jgi:hypothetical protein
MRISFDLDETLVCRRIAAPNELGLGASIARWVFDEPLRLGTRQLFSELRAQNHEIWIYTTSLRSEHRTRTWLRLHGLKIDGYVNNSIHCETKHSVRGLPAPSKYPPSFGIDLHVDDLDGVRLEGERHGFKVLVVRPEDEDWVEKVLETVGGLSAS